MQVVMDLPRHPEETPQGISIIPMEPQFQPLPQVKPFQYHIPQLPVVITWNTSNYGLTSTVTEF